tara:strand:- start:64 stop:792 length:729 start_codon:yes stop_codon:yes gene_type:complete
MRYLSIIIPTFNDQNIIKNKILFLIKNLRKMKIKYEIIIVNDGSSDDTLRELKSIKSKKNYIKIINNRKNCGKSYSIKKGLKVAKHEHIVLVDSDLPYFDTFEKIIKKLKQNYDFVFINRRHKNSRIINKKLNFYQISRIFIGWLVSLFVKLLLNFNLLGGDTQSGLKGFKKIKNFNKLNFVSTKFFLDLEIMYFYNKLNRKFYSIPVKYKIAEKSSIKIFSVKKNFEILIELIRVIQNLKK